MNKMTKLISLLLALILCIGCFAACDMIPGMNDVPPEEIDLSNCVIESEIVFSSSDDKMQSAIQAMSSSVKTEISGTTIKVSTVASTGDTSVESTYIYAYGTIYSNTSIESGKYSVTTLKKAWVDEENRESLLDSIGAGVSIGIDDFYSHEIDKNDKGYVYTCSDITDEARSSLEDIYGARFLVLGAELDVSYAKLVLEKNGDVINDLSLEIGFVIDMDGETYEVTMNQTSKYTYGSTIQIFTPNNITDYEDVSYEEIIR